jgi:outer membrane protein TolC
MKHSMKTRLLGMSRIGKATSVTLAVVAFSGCATFSQDGGMEAVSTMTSERTGQPVKRVANKGEMSAVDARVNELLAQPLAVDTAVQVALMSNRGLQASLADLGISEAALVQTGRLRNPGFSFERMRNGGVLEIERSIVFDVIGLITMPARLNIERRRFEQTQRQAAMQAVRIASQTRNAYYTALAANESVRYMEQVKSAAEAGSELGRQMARVGNWSKLDQVREQAFYADATAQLARAQNSAVAAREELARLLGLWGEATQFKLPERLPDLPKSPKEVANIEQQAIDQRLDVQSARMDALALASSLGLTRATGVVDAFEAGYLNKSETGSSRTNGYELSLELPIFDWGGARAARAEAMYMQSVHRTADVAIRARSEVRAAYSAYRTSYDLAKHYRDEIVPLRKKISEELLLRYNGMLISVFDLLADARTQVGSVNASIEALRDFWLAESNMQMALTGSGGATTGLDAKAAATEANAGH